MLSKYSHSALDTFRSCPKRFSFKYIEHVEADKRVTVETMMGNIVHQVLNHLYDVASHCRILKKEELIDHYRQLWESAEKEHLVVIKDHLAVDDYIASGRKMLETYYDQYHPFDQGTTLAMEDNIHFTLPGTSVAFSAKIDRLWKRSDGTVEICDYKTGGRLPSGGQDPAFFFQMGVYQLAVREKFPQFERIELAQYFLKFNEVIRYSMTDDDLDRLIQELKDTVGQTIHADRLGTFSTSEGPLCDYCEYFNLCPAKRHRVLLTREAGEKEETEEITTAEAAAELAEKFIDLDARLKELKAEHEAMKGDLTNAAMALDVNKLQAPSGTVSVSRKTVDKFITKSQDASQFADLSHLVRELGLEDYMLPDTNGILKDIYGKGRLIEEDEKKLSEFIIRKEDIRVSARPKKRGGDSD